METFNYMSVFGVALFSIMIGAMIVALLPDPPQQPLEKQPLKYSGLKKVRKSLKKKNPKSKKKAPKKRKRRKKKSAKKRKKQ